MSLLSEKNGGINSELNAEIKIRVSARAKYACLKVTAAGIIEVVIPKGFSQTQVPEFIARHQAWLNKTVARLRLGRDPELDVPRPRQIHLQAVNETWQVNYGQRKKSGVNEYRKPDNDLQLWVWSCGPAGDVAHLLGRWLAGRAKPVLKQWLDEISAHTGLSYNKLSVRAQKTRWGSCSHKKHINLNRALLFLPEELVRYLIIHELCHTAHLNHSKAFWSLVARWAPQYKKHEKQLNLYSGQIPSWALP